MFFLFSFFFLWYLCSLKPSVFSFINSVLDLKTTFYKGTCFRISCETIMFRDIVLHIYMSSYPLLPAEVILRYVVFCYIIFRRVISAFSRTMPEVLHLYDPRQFRH